jgi:hypothetical protein
VSFLPPVPCKRCFVCCVSLEQFAMDSFDIEAEIPSTRKIIRMVMKAFYISTSHTVGSARAPVVPNTPASVGRLRHRPKAIAPDEFMVEDTPMIRLRQLLDRFDSSGMLKAGLNCVPAAPDSSPPCHAGCAATVAVPALFTPHT